MTTKNQSFINQYKNISQNSRKEQEQFYIQKQNYTILINSWKYIIILQFYSLHSD